MLKVSKKFNTFKKFCKQIDEDLTKAAVLLWFPDKYSQMYPSPSRGRSGSLPATPKTKRKHSNGDPEDNKRLDNKKTPVKMAPKPGPILEPVSGSQPEASTASAVGGNVAPLASASGASAAPVASAAGGNVGGEITNASLDALDTTLDNMRIGGLGGPPGPPTNQETFADKVKVKKVNRAYAYAAFVFGGTDEERVKISRKHFNEFVEHYVKEAKTLSPAEQDRLDIEFSTYSDGIGIVACADDATLRWIKKEALSFEYDSKPTRAWARWERASAMQYHGFLHGEHYRKERPSVVIGDALKARNIPGKFENCIFTPDKDGVYVCFEPDKILAKELSKTMVLKVSCNKIRLGRRVRRQHTEAEFVEFMAMKNSEAMKVEEEQKAKREKSQKEAKEKAAKKAASAGAEKRKSV